MATVSDVNKPQQVQQQKFLLFPLFTQEESVIWVVTEHALMGRVLPHAMQVLTKVPINTGKSGHLSMTSL